MKSSHSLTGWSNTPNLVYRNRNSAPWWPIWVMLHRALWQQFSGNPVECLLQSDWPTTAKNGRVAVGSAINQLTTVRVPMTYRVSVLSAWAGRRSTDFKLRPPASETQALTNRNRKCSVYDCRLNTWDHRHQKRSYGKSDASFIVRITVQKSLRPNPNQSIIINNVASCKMRTQISSFLLLVLV